MFCGMQHPHVKPMLCGGFVCNSNFTYLCLYFDFRNPPKSVGPHIGAMLFDMIYMMYRPILSHTTYLVNDTTLRSKLLPFHPDG